MMLLPWQGVSINFMGGGSEGELKGDVYLFVC